MPTGGEAEKVGNRFESIWTVFRILGLVRNDATELHTEPTNTLGVEFIETKADGIKE
jgi:hypothetical protein